VTIGELLGNPNAQTPILAVIAAGLLAVARVVGKRAAASMQRQGARLGAVEDLQLSERTRRRQLEECLRANGFPLPYWPDDPPELYRPPPPRYRYDDEDEDPAAAGERLVYDPPTTEQRRPVPAPPSHRR
jgi:hypothetical protein